MAQDLQPTFAKIEEWQQLGYEAWKQSKRSRAVEFWQIAWQLVTSLMQDDRFASLADLDKAWHGRQSISSWAADFGEALYLAGLVNPADLPASVEFNRQILAWSGNANDINNRNRRRMVAESTFKTAGPIAGDAAYQEYLSQNPRWGWGWVSWADQYGFDSQAPWHDLKRAENILRQALQVQDLDNRTFVLERLRDILLQQGRPTEAAAIEITDAPGSAWRLWLDRNRLCSCGSGKRHKNCCGR
jgi:hypothetical protein